MAGWCGVPFGHLDIWTGQRFPAARLLEGGVDTLQVSLDVWLEEQDGSLYTWSLLSLCALSSCWHCSGQ